LKEKEETVRKKTKTKTHCQKSCGPLPNSKEALISKSLLKEKKKKEAPQGKQWALARWHRSIDFFKPNL
jgi:hypothetical protein